MSVTSAPTFNAVARMAAIQARFDQMAAAAAPKSTAATGTPPGSSAVDPSGGTDFSSILRAATAATSGSAGAAGAAYGGAGSTGSVTGHEIVDVASEYLGIPYVWGGTNPDTGLDCSGFVQNVFARFGVDLPRVSRQQAQAGEPVASIDQARPGDVIAFGEPVDHIGIYVGDNKIIHAPKTGDVVKISTIYRKPTAIRRLIQTDSTPSFGTLDAAAGAGFSGAVAAGIGGGVGNVSGGVARYSAMFEQAGARWGISPKVLAAVAQQESGGNPDAVSRSGALGLMQFMPATARSFGIDPLDPKQAIDGAARYLSQQLDAFGSIELALAAYNAGPGAVRKHGGIPPYPETQAYVRKIMTRLGGNA